MTWVAACWGTCPRSIGHMSRWDTCIIFMCSIIITGLRKLTSDITLGKKMERGEIKDICFWKDHLEFLSLEIIMSISNKWLLQCLNLSSYVWSKILLWSLLLDAQGTVSKVSIGYVLLSVHLSGSCLEISSLVFSET